MVMVMVMVVVMVMEIGMEREIEIEREIEMVIVMVMVVVMGRELERVRVERRKNHHSPLGDRQDGVAQRLVMSRNVERCTCFTNLSNTISKYVPILHVEAKLTLCSYL